LLLTNILSNLKASAACPKSRPTASHST
jgi:hypothetical protein